MTLLDYVQGPSQQAASFGAAFGEDVHGQYFLGPAESQPYQQNSAMQPAPAGMQYKKCNCKKAKCLKLYCVCFAAGVYCQGCTCSDCSNLPEKSNIVLLERQRVLQREPMAFTSKVAGPVHSKGCKCRKSRCIKKYCDCFDAKVRCSDICKCKDCRNQPDGYDPNSSSQPVAHMQQRLQQEQPLILSMQHKQASCGPLEFEISPATLQLQASAGGMGELPMQPCSLPLLHPSMAPVSLPALGSRPTSRAASPSGQVACLFRPGALQHLSSNWQQVAPVSAPALTTLAAGSSRLDAMMADASSNRGVSPPAASETSAAANAVMRDFFAWANSAPMPEGPCSMNGHASGPTTGLLYQQGRQQQDDVPCDCQFQQQQQQGMQLHRTLGASAATQQLSRPDSTMLPTTALHMLEDARRLRSNDGHEQASMPIDGTVHQGDSVQGHQPHGTLERAVARPVGDAAVSRANSVAAEQTAAGPADISNCQAGSESGDLTVAPQLVNERSSPKLGSVMGIRPGKGIQNGAFVAVGQAIMAQLVKRESSQQPEPVEVQQEAAADVWEQMEQAAHSAATQQQQQPQPHQQQAGQKTQQHQQQQQRQQVTPAALVSSGSLGPSQQPQVTNTALQQQPAVDHEDDAQENVAADSTTGAAAGLAVQQQVEKVDAGAGAAAQLPCTANDGVAPAASGAADASTAPPNRRLLYEPQRHAQQVVQCYKVPMLPPKPASLLASSHLIEESDTGGQPCFGGQQGGGCDVVASMEPAAFGALACSLGLGQDMQSAVMSAAHLLRDVVLLSQLKAASAAGADAAVRLQEAHAEQQQWDWMQQQARQLHQVVQSAALAPTSFKAHPHQMRLRHEQGVPSPTTCGHIAVLTSQPLAAIQAFQGQTAAVAIASTAKTVPALSGLQRLQSGGIGTPTALPEGVEQCHAAAMAAVTGRIADLATGLGLAASNTPSPLLATAHRASGSLRGPSPLGPAAGTRAPPAAGLYALMRPGQHQRVQNQQQLPQKQLQPEQQLQQDLPADGTPIASGAVQLLAAPGSVTGSACGAPRRSVQLLPGSFRLAGHLQSPGATASPAATSSACLHDVQAVLATGAYDSPAGSISFALSTASVDPAASAGLNQPGMADQGSMPMFSNSQKQIKSIQERQHEQLVQGQAVEANQLAAAAAAAPLKTPKPAVASVPAAEALFGPAIGVEATPAAGPTPPSAAAGLMDNRASAAMQGVGALTPLEDLDAYGVLAAAGAPTPSFWQQLQRTQQQQHSLPNSEQGHASEPGSMALFSNGHAAAGAGLHDMTPSSLFIASVIAARTPTDMFLGSPLPPIASALCGAAASGPVSLLRARCGVEVTPVLLHTGCRLAAGSGSTGVRNRAGLSVARQWCITGRHRSGVGVGALCTGWAGSSGAAGQNAPSAAVNGTAAKQLDTAGSEDTSAAVVAAEPAARHGLTETSGPNDAPASGMKPDTDKAAARAGSRQPVADCGMVADTKPCDAGVSKLLAAADYISSPLCDGSEVPAKRRKYDHMRAPAWGEGIADPKQQIASLSHAADNARGSALQLEAAGSCPSTAACASDQFGTVAAITDAIADSGASQDVQPPRGLPPAVRVLMPAVAASDILAKHGWQGISLHSATAAQQQQVECQQVLHYLDRGSFPQEGQHQLHQVMRQPGRAQEVQEAGLNQQPVQQLHKAASMQQVQQVPEQQQFNQQCSQLLQQQHWGMQQPDGIGMELEHIELVDAHPAPMDSRRLIAAHTLKGQEVDDAVHKHDMLLQSPPAKWRPVEIDAKQGSSDRSPSIESFAAADAMLALCEMKNSRQQPDRYCAIGHS